MPYEVHMDCRSIEVLYFVHFFHVMVMIYYKIVRFDLGFILINTNTSKITSLRHDG